MRELIAWSRVPFRSAMGLLLVVMAGVACGGKKARPVQVLVPPRLDVKQYGSRGSKL
jgi:hypothetical protein